MLEAAYDSYLFIPLAPQFVRKIIKNNPYMFGTYKFGHQGTVVVIYNVQDYSLYYVDAEGGMLKGTRFSVGSGSRCAFGFMEDSGYVSSYPYHLYDYMYQYICIFHQQLFA